jgi:hypothetical protein
VRSSRPSSQKTPRSPEPGRQEEINQLLEKKEGIYMAVESLKTISQDENERARLLTIEKNLTDWQAGIVHAKRKGRKEAEDYYKPILAQQAAEIAELKRQLGQK